MHVLVTGASGFIGSNLVPALLERGYEVSALTRDKSRYNAPKGVNIIEGNLLKKDSLKNKFNDIDAAYCLVHSLHTGKGFEKRDRIMAKNFTETVNVDHLIYLGGLGDTAENLSPHLRSRREVEEILNQGDCSFTTLRAAIIIGDKSASFQMIKQLIEQLLVMTPPKCIKTKCQPIALDDVITYLIGVLETPEAAGKTLEIGGPETMTYKEIVKKTSKLMGKEKTYIFPIPYLSLKLSAHIVGLLTDVRKEIAYELMLGLKNKVIAKNKEIERYIQINLTPFKQAVKSALNKEDTPIKRKYRDFTPTSNGPPLKGPSIEITHSSFDYATNNIEKNFMHQETRETRNPNNLDPKE